MTTTAPAPVVPRAIDARSTEWRQLGHWLWVARRDGRHVGTFERGRRFVVTDVTGHAVGAYRTLDEAVAAVEAPQRGDAAVNPGVRAPWQSAAVIATLVLGGGVAMGAGALAVLAAR